MDIILWLFVAFILGIILFSVFSLILGFVYPTKQINDGNMVSVIETTDQSIIIRRWIGLFFVVATVIMIIMSSLRVIMDV